MGISLTYLYARLIISSPLEKFKDYRELVHTKNNIARHVFDLKKDSYLIRIKHIIVRDEEKKVFINGSLLKEGVYIYHYIRRRGIIETTYMHIPKGLINDGKNTIDIYFSKNAPPDLNIILSNCRKKIGDGIYVLFSDSLHIPSGEISIKAILQAVIIIFSLFAAMILFLNIILYPSFNRLLLYQIYSLLPFLVFLAIIWVYNSLNKTYRVMFTFNYYLKLGIISFFIINICLLFPTLRRRKNIKENSIIDTKLLNSAIKAITRVRIREFSDKCILLFMALLMVSTLIYLSDLREIAEQFANVACLALITGVVIKFIIFLKNQDKT